MHFATLDAKNRFDDQREIEQAVRLALSRRRPRLLRSSLLARPSPACLGTLSDENVPNPQSRKDFSVSEVVIRL